jgi:uncharacterized alpha/beta hydrolase family protein
MGEGYFTTKGRRSFLIAVFILVALFVALLSIQFYLYFNFLLGNDIAVRAAVDKEFLDLKHGDKEDIEVSATVFTNPFCEAMCNYSFSNLANGEKVKSGYFKFSNSEPFSERYEIEAPVKGVGETVYRFEIFCMGSENFLCYTGAEPFYQNALIVMRYDLTDEEQQLKNQTKNLIVELIGNFSYWENYFLELSSEIASSPIQIDGINKEVVGATSAKENVTEVKSLWEKEEYSTVRDYLNEGSRGYERLQEEFSSFKNNSNFIISRFNNLTDEFNFVQAEFKELSEANFSDEFIQEANFSSVNFVAARDNFLQKGGLPDKDLYLEIMELELDNIRTIIQESMFNDTERDNSLGLDFEVILVERLMLNESYEDYVAVKEPIRSCCLFENCRECCEDCKANESLYPVLFLHGHDFSARVSAEYNLNIFGKMQRELEKEGLLNAGTMMINVPEETPERVWGQIVWPVSVKMSYYFDSVKEEGKLNIHQTKKDNIDTYSIRLKNAIDSVKKKTGKDKVILITHSMGGLVARRYIQIFGEEDVYKLVMIASPNKGISESAYGYCAAFGEIEECRDMKGDSLFLRKLMNQEFTNIEVYNIIGIGCETYDSDGDGIVQKESAVMSDVKNYYVLGDCSGFDYLHSEIVEPDKYPETYEIIKGILKS